MKLYTSLGPNPMVVSFFLLEKKLPPGLIQPVEVDIIRGRGAPKG